jgi:hypothetical protein
MTRRTRRLVSLFWIFLALCLGWGSRTALNYVMGWEEPSRHSDAKTLHIYKIGPNGERQEVDSLP